MLHLLLSVERVEVVVIGELGATGDLAKGKKTNPVNSIHRPVRGYSHVRNIQTSVSISSEIITHTKVHVLSDGYTFLHVTLSFNSFIPAQRSDDGKQTVTQEN